MPDYNPDIQPETWNALNASFPNPHLLQTWEWGEVKARAGWEPIPMIWREKEGEVRSQVVAMGMILQRTLPVGGFAARLRVLYVPKGPLLMDWGDSTQRRRVLRDLKTLARRRGAIFIKIDPDVCLGTGIPGTSDEMEIAEGQALVADLLAHGWHFSDEQIQFRNTVMIDLTPSEDALLARMKQKTRYNIRLSMRKGVTVRTGTQADFGMLYRMYAETALRDGFIIRDEGYYRAVWEKFMRTRTTSHSTDNSSRLVASGGRKSPENEVLVAEVDGKPVAALIVYRFARKAWYLYGMSQRLHREKMPNYALQWEAMRRAKAAGCLEYDLWGAPDEFNESDSMWGVYRFKEGLGGKLVRHVGAWDLPVRPIYYRLYTEILPRLLGLMRYRGKAHTRRSIGES